MRLNDTADWAIDCTGGLANNIELARVVSSGVIMVVRSGSSRVWVGVLGLALCVSLGLGAGCSDDGGSVPVDPPADVTLEGPITEPGMPFVAGTRELDLEDAGFRESEYFVSGTAVSYTNIGSLPEDGRWRVEPAETAEYKTRILVYQPIDSNAFSGTVILEWLNVSGGLDAAPDWNAIHTEAFREGHVWVGVSAQRVGVEGSSGGINLGLKIVNPDRYGSLSHPGDSFSYEIFAQVARAVRSPVDLDPLDGLVAEQVIAMGESQSAGRLLSYVNALATRYEVFDGYLIHSRGGGSPPLSQSPQAEINTPEIVHVRDDLDEPTLLFQTETDLISLGALPDRQDDSEMFRQWEVAGTAHNDTYTLVVSNSDLGDDPSVADVVEIVNPAPGFTCEFPINSGPQHWVLKAGLRGLIEWVADGNALPTSPRLIVNETADGYQLDAVGNALGGIRTSYVDAPVAVLSGLGQPGDSFCRIWGTTRLLDPAELAELYPTAASYIDAVTESTDAAVDAGFILPADASLIISAAEASGIGE
ncbi:MAG: alpha/beta hydrolase domain-containing protein [Polyangiales bacterium]